MSSHPGSLVALLHLCDSLFPIGSYAHSDGLEAATASGAVASAADLRRWLEATLDETLMRCDGPAVRSAWAAFVSGRLTDLQIIDAEAEAVRPSSAFRQASRAMGASLLSTWRQIRPCPELDAVVPTPGRRGLTLPVAFSVVCAASQIGCRETLEGYFYTRLASIASSAMRLIAIGQNEAHTLLADSLGRVSEAADTVLSSLDPPGTFAPALDIASMSQQYVRSRLFRS